MKLSLFLFVALLAFCSTSFAMEYHGDDWTYQTAESKLKQLWQAVMKEQTPYGWFSPFTQAQILIEDMDPTMEFEGDDFPTQYIFNISTRKKLIHSVGGIAVINWNSMGDHGLTGIFNGSTTAMFRLSVANEPDFDSDWPIRPGAGLKFLRTNAPSAGFPVMFSLDGSQSYNLFAHDLTNHVPNNDPTTPDLIALKKKFLGTSDWPTMIALSDCARIDSDGNVVENPKFPFRIVLHPVNSAHFAFPDTMPPSKSEVYYVDQLPQLKPGILYYVYAQMNTSSEDLTLIANIETTTRFTASVFGDKTWFMRHQRMEEDFEIHPEWKEYSAELNKKQAAVPHWVFPDLPWTDIENPELNVQLDPDYKPIFHKSIIRD